MIAFVLIFLFSATLLISEEFIPLTFFLAKWLAFLGWRWKITTHKKTSMFKNFYPSWTHSDWLSCWKAIYAYRLVIACKYFTGCCVCGRKYTCYSLGDFPRNYLCDECNNSSHIELTQLLPHYVPDLPLTTQQRPKANSPSTYVCVSTHGGESLSPHILTFFVALHLCAWV